MLHTGQERQLPDKVLAECFHQSVRDVPSIWISKAFISSCCITELVPITPSGNLLDMQPVFHNIPDRDGGGGCSHDV